MTQNDDNRQDALEVKADDKDAPSSRPGFLRVVQSVFAAIFGIQSDKNREKDFNSGDASQYIAVGIVAVIVIMVVMIIIVNQVLDSANAH